MDLVKQSTLRIHHNTGYHVHHPDGLSKPTHLKTQVFNDYRIIGLSL